MVTAEKPSATAADTRLAQTQSQTSPRKLWLTGLD